MLLAILFILIILAILAVLVLANIFVLKKIAGSLTTAHSLFIVLSSLLIVLMILYELYYYFFDDRNCSSGDTVVKLTWWSRAIGYILFLGTYYYTFKCFCGQLKVPRWFCIIGMAILPVIHYNNTYSVTFSAACGQEIHTEHFFTSESVGRILWEEAFCDTNYTFESLVKGIYGSERRGNTMYFYRVNDRPALVRTGYLFWQLEDYYYIDPKYQRERQEELQRNETTLRTCYLHRGKFKKTE
jgi:hypothetical protein